MADIDTLVTGIGVKIEQVIDRLECLQRENIQDKETIQTLQNENTSLTETIETLQQHIIHLTTAQNQHNTEIPASRKEKIDELLREIDHCLEIVSR